MANRPQKVPRTPIIVDRVTDPHTNTPIDIFYNRHSHAFYAHVADKAFTGQTCEEVRRKVLAAVAPAPETGWIPHIRVSFATDAPPRVDLVELARFAQGWRQRVEGSRNYRDEGELVFGREMTFPRSFASGDAFGISNLGALYDTTYLAHDPAVLGALQHHGALLGWLFRLAKAGVEELAQRGDTTGPAWQALLATTAAIDHLHGESEEGD